MTGKELTDEELQEIADTYGLYTEQDVENRVSCELLRIGARNEELEKEASEKYFNHKMSDFQGFYPRHYYYLGYVESAEPREKRISELEKENKELEERLTEVKLDSLQNFNRSLRAKEIIKLLLSDLGNRSYEPVKDVERAEQFLKECE